MPTDVRSPMVVSPTSPAETVTGNFPHFMVQGHNAGSPESTAGLHARAAYVDREADMTVPGSPGAALKQSLMGSYSAFRDVRASIGHAEGEAVLKAQNKMMEAGRAHATAAFTALPAADQHAILAASGARSIAEYAAFESSAMAWNDVAQHGEIIGPRTGGGRAYNQRSIAGSNPGAFVTDLDTGEKTRWATCGNCQAQIMPNMRKHS